MSSSLHTLMFANSIPSQSRNFALVFVLEMLLLIIQIYTEKSGHGALLIVVSQIYPWNFQNVLIEDNDNCNASSYLNIPDSKNMLLSPWDLTLTWKCHRKTD